MTSAPPRSLLSVNDLQNDHIQRILDVAQQFHKEPASGATLLTGRIVVTLFFEPSTRTRLSFESAALRLNARVISVADAISSSSVSKGETIADTVRIVESYSDLIVMRHPIEGSAAEAARYAHVPIVNAGDGAGEHPTQALLDLFTIQSERGSISGTTVALVGDLRFGRTVHSLCRLLARWGCTMLLVSPPSLELPPSIATELHAAGAHLREATLEEALQRAEVIYVTRIQKERFADGREYETVRGSYRLTASLLHEHAPQATILHPLPRIDEIATDVDALPAAAYFRQAANGIPVRMAILALLLRALPW
ncbi:MAG: aspartate carbamoyltransferase [Chloroflexi bacterium]|nr:aspartate carbamoyltransferase [Chloroflexota bacterium]